MIIKATDEQVRQICANAMTRSSVGTRKDSERVIGVGTAGEYGYAMVGHIQWRQYTAAEMDVFRTKAGYMIGEAGLRAVNIFIARHVGDTWRVLHLTSDGAMELDGVPDPRVQTWSWLRPKTYADLIATVPGVEIVNETMRPASPSEIDAALAKIDELSAEAFAP